MPSSATTRLRLEKQATGENSNTWGSKLNSTAFDLLDTAIAGRSAFNLSGAKTLTSTNYAADESRAIFLDITSGTGGTVTIPGVEKVYLVRNNTSGSAILTTGSGATATLASTEVAWVATDGTNVYRTTDNNAAQAVPWTEIDSESTASGSLATFSSIPDTYSDLVFVFEGLSVSTPSTTLAMAISADVATWSSTANVTSTLSDSALYYGAVEVDNYNSNAGRVGSSLTNLSLNPQLSSAVNFGFAWRCTGGIAAVRFSPAAGSFDAGTIRLFGR